MTRTIARILSAALLLGALTACGTSPAADHDTSRASADTTTSVEQPAAADDTSTGTADDSDMTDLVVDITWGQTTETDRDSLCDGITMFGTDWAAEQLRQGGGDDAGVDWSKAALILEDKCQTR